MIEHRLEDVLALDFDRLLVFSEGELIADETPDELLKSNVLERIGIREPLYIQALRKAGMKLDRLSSISSIQRLELPHEIQAAWQQLIQEEKEELPLKDKLPLLTAKNITYHYPGSNTAALYQVNCSINEGEMVSIVGKNGAGKSTFVKLICGFIKENSGELLYKGKSLSRLSIKKRAEKIGFVMQNPNQMISKTMIQDEISLGLRLRKLPEEEITRRVEEALKICGLYPYRNWPISALSFGQKKRVTIAAILVLQPEMIILDEPTAGQDYHHYKEMMDFLKKLNEQGITIVMITHDMHLMLEYTTRSLVFTDAKLLADLDPVALLTDGDLMKQAALKETSLVTMANKLLLDSKKFILAYIQEKERVEK